MRFGRRVVLAALPFLPARGPGRPPSYAEDIAAFPPDALPAPVGTSARC